MEQSSTIQKAIKSTNLTALVLAAIAILLLALLVAFNIKPLYNHFTGPFEVSSEELISYHGPQDTFRTYVTTYPIMALDTAITCLKNWIMALNLLAILIMRCCLMTGFCWQSSLVPGEAMTFNQDL
jgi:signal peptidase I